MKLGDLIKKRREELKLTQEELADLLKYKSKSTINKIEKNVNDIPFSKLEDFARVLKVDKAYLLGWKSEKTELQKKSNITPFDSERIRIPLFESISAGYGAIIDDVFIDNTDYKYINEDYFNGWKYCFAVKVKGDSMDPPVPDGAIAIINTSEAIYPNQIGAFMIDGEYFLKTKKINSNMIVLKSNNNKYEDIIITPEKDFKEIGRLIKITIDFRY